MPLSPGQTETRTEVVEGVTEGTLGREDTRGYRVPHDLRSRDDLPLFKHKRT